MFLNSLLKEIRRNEKQIIANQVSLKVKEKLLKNKKGFYCITVSHTCTARNFPMLFPGNYLFYHSNIL